MNETQHTFPIPETEARRLEEVERQLQKQPLHLRARDFIRAYRWHALSCAGVIGLLLGVSLRQAEGRCSTE